MAEKFLCRGCGREVEIETTRCPECGAELERVVTERGGQPFEAFIASLVREHEAFREQLRDIRAALTKPDPSAALASLRRFGTSLDRHVVDEEARVLRVLIDAHGRDGAGDAIRTMQQHRPVRKLVDELMDFLSSHMERAPSKLAELEKLAEEHFKAEEGRIFPWAIETSKKPARNT
jgi:hemerythrin-like domain-containing protein